MKKFVSVLLFMLIVVCVHAQIKVACIGNSITAGGYPTLLQEQLGASWEVRNFGVSGSTLLRNGDHPYNKTQTFAAAKAFNPDVVIIKLGTNDSKPQNWKYAVEYQPNYTQLIRELQALPSKPY